MTDQHSVPSELLNCLEIDEASPSGLSWRTELKAKWMGEDEGGPGVIGRMIDRAAQWGADQELEACCEAIKDLEWFEDPRIRLAELRATRRPKPPTLAEQGMEALRSTPCTEQRHYDALFAALNRLAELEDSNG